MSSNDTRSRAPNTSFSCTLRGCASQPAGMYLVPGGAMGRPFAPVPVGLKGLNWGLGASGRLASAMKTGADAAELETGSKASGALEETWLRSTGDGALGTVKSTACAVARALPARHRKRPAMAYGRVNDTKVRVLKNESDGISRAPSGSSKRSPGGLPLAAAPGGFVSRTLNRGATVVLVAARRCTKRTSVPRRLPMQHITAPMH